MRIGEQAVVDVFLRKSIPLCECRTVECQRPVDSGCSHGEDQFGSSVVGVGHLQLQGGDGSGFPFVHRQAVVGQHRGVVHRVDGDDKDRLQFMGKRIHHVRLHRLPVGVDELEAVLGGLAPVVLVGEQVVFEDLLGEIAVHPERLPVQLHGAVSGGGSDGVGQVRRLVVNVGHLQQRAADGAAAALVHRQTVVGVQLGRVVHRGDGDLEGWALRLIFERIETAGGGINADMGGTVGIAEGEAVGGGLTAVMRIRHQAVVDVTLGKGVLVGERCPVQLQVSVGRGAEDMEYKLSRRVVHIRQAQIGGGQGTGSPLVHRQAGVGQHRGVVYRGDGDVKGARARASLGAV